MHFIVYKNECGLRTGRFFSDGTNSSSWVWDPWIRLM